MTELPRAFGVYEVLSELGAGGMGTVYRARDPRLDRIVAIKVLTQANRASDSQRLRFEREARTASALSHPNICALYDVGRQDEVDFLVMEYLEGATLANRLAAAPLPLDEALSIAVALADALACAHRAGVVHRDIKPHNVMLTRSGPKLLDFGLAKRTHGEPPSEGLLETRTLTAEGKIVGTLQYMAPEQLQGREADARSDIFSFGAMLYEMLTGRGAFAAENPASVIGAVLHRDPFGESGVDVFPELERILRKCLARDPDQRWQSAQDLRDELEWTESRRQHARFETRQDARVGSTVVRPGKPLAKRSAVIGVVALLAVAAVVAAGFWSKQGSGDGGIASLAVLPFVNVGADLNTEYLSDGITENLINSFSQLPQLRVVPRTRVFLYKGRQVEPEKAGRELKVLAVLTGRIVQRGDDLNIQTELVDVARNSQLWGRQYTRKLSDLITVQEEIAREITDRLGLKPTSDERRRLTKRYTENPEAHQLYLKGRYWWNRRTRETLRRAAQFFQQAIEKDPAYAPAWAGLADCYGVFSIYGVLSSRQAIPRAKQAAAKALELDDSLAEAHASLGYADSYDWDWTGAEKEFSRAIDLNPSYATGHHWRGTNFLEPMGRLDEGLLELKRAQELDPLSPIIAAVVARDLYFARRYDEAQKQLRETLDLDPSFALAHAYVGLAYEQQGRIDEAVAAFQKWQTLSGDEPTATGALGHAYAIAGRSADARTALARLQEMSQNRYVSPYDVAVIDSGLGDKDHAFEWLAKAADDHSAWLIWIKVDPRFDGIRDDRRYHDLLRRMRIPD